MSIKIFSSSLIVMFVCVNAFAMCGMCGSGPEHEHKGSDESVFSHVAGETAMKGGVKEISYDQFMRIRNSGEKYVLLDVLAKDSYAKGHIEGAGSFPVDTINKSTAAKRLSKDDNIIVYCGSFQCPASTGAAKKLSGLGYDVLDYKGGLKEWQEKGNRLVSGE